MIISFAALSILVELVIILLQRKLLNKKLTVLKVASLNLTFFLSCLFKQIMSIESASCF